MLNRKPAFRRTTWHRQPKLGLLAALLVLPLCLAHAQTDPMRYANLYLDCEDTEYSPIYGATYGDYPPNLVDAEFPGGVVEFSMFLAQNTRPIEVYGEDVDTDGTKLLMTGQVLVEFVIDRCGQPCNFRILQSLSPQQDEEALRVIQSLPVFKAATIDGIRVKSAYIAPVKFKWKRMPKRKFGPDQTPDYEDPYNYDYENVDWW